MERSEPTLVPEWLKGTGSISGGGSTSHHSASSSLHSDDHAVTLPTRNRSSSLSFGDYDNPRSSAFSDRTSSSYFRRSSSSNGSMAHGKDPVSYSRSYSSFSRSHRDKDWDKDLLDFPEKERSGLGEHRDRDYSDSVSASALTSRIEKDALRRSQSMISAKRGDLWPKRMGTDSNNAKNNSHNNNNGANVGSAIISNNHKTAFLERDFPSLGAEEKQGATDIGRVSSPVLGNAVQSLQMGTSAVLSEGWTSALVEVPVMIGSNNMGLSSAQQTSPASSATSVPSITTGRNMAETLAQAPSRARAAPQLSVETQRLEELAIKQSRQLIPVTPSMPKTSALASEKPKPKPVARMGEMSMANKIGQQQQLISSQLANHSQHGGSVRSDVVPKTSVGGKLLVLKPAREKNGMSPATNGSSPTNASKVANNPLTTASSVALTSPNSAKLAPAQRKGSLVPATLASSMEKKPTPSHAQSRNDFFNSMRKKTSTNHSSSALPDPPVASTAVMKKSGELVTEVGAAPVSPQGSDPPLSDSTGLDWSVENGGDVGSNGNPYDESQGFPDRGDDHSIPDAIVYPDEKEAAFLRSLGWDENEEGGGLTTEEINSFYKSVQCMELRPSLKLCRGSHQLKLKSLLGSQGGNLDSNSPSGLNPSNSKS